MKKYKQHEEYIPPIVLDCEASGLVRESYPIEVGYALESGEIESYLIRPEPSWDYWDIKAEQVHHIPREQLFSEGLLAHTVALRLNGQLAGETVYSDAADFDRMWLERLFIDAGVEMNFEVGNLFTTFINHQHGFFYKHKKRLALQVQAHRAGNDAWIIQTAANESRKDAIQKIVEERRMRV